MDTNRDKLIYIDTEHTADLAYVQVCGIESANQ